MPIQLGMSDGELRSAVDQIIAEHRNPDDHDLEISGVTRRLAERALRDLGRDPGSVVGPNLSETEVGRVHDIIWDLIVLGYIRPGTFGESRNHALPFFHVTKKGMDYFASLSG